MRLRLPAHEAAFVDLWLPTELGDAHAYFRRSGHDHCDSLGRSLTINVPARFPSDGSDSYPSGCIGPGQARAVVFGTTEQVWAPVFDMRDATAVDWRLHSADQRMTPLGAKPS